MVAHVRTAQARSVEASEIASELAEALGSPTPQLLLFFASSRLAFEDIARHLHRAFAGTITVGTTTCGEIGPQGCTTGTVSALAFSAPAQAAASVIPHASAFRFAQGAPLLEELCVTLGETTRSVAQRAEDFVLLTLSDGLAAQEEILLASLFDAAPSLPLVGGSSADDYEFSATAIACKGETHWGGSVTILLRPGAPFHAFHLHHFAPRGEASVITAAEPLKRLVSRIDGFPALGWLAKKLGFDEAQLRENPGEFLARQPVVFGARSGDATFMRSVMNVQDEALLLGGAMEEGSVIHLMQGGDIVEASRRGMAAAISQVPEACASLLFNCGGRMWEANTLGVVSELAQAMSPIPAAGFTTYGEQFGPLQINHTLTGLVFGTPHD